MVKRLLSVRFIVSLLVGLPAIGFAQTGPVIVQAEGGTLGADWRSLQSDGVQYVTSQTSGAGQTPGTDARVITYTVPFSIFGTYDLYARMRVGAGGFDDDSFYYSNGFGVKSATDATNWITVNGLNSVGFTAANDVVTGAGNAENGVWKWVKLSDFNGGEAPITFTVPAGNLSRTFSIGAREDGLELDKFAFVATGSSVTVSALDAGQTTTGPPANPPIAYGKPKFLGNVHSPSQIEDFLTYWNQVVPENAGKWGSVEATRDVMNWTQLDAAYALAKQNGLPYRMHVMLWGNQQPTWIETLPAAEQLEEIKEWFAAVAARYPDIDFIEIVNEPLNDAPNRAGDGGGNYVNALGGNGTTGWDWLIAGFRLGRQYFPNAKLMINEYNIVNSANNTNRYLQVINLLKAENLIDAIGVQAHAFSTTAASSTITANLNTLGATGLPIYATEMDIDGPTDQVQLQDYQRIFPLFWEHPAVKGVTLWGSRPGLWRNDQGAFLIRSNGEERPALTWLRNYVKNNAVVTSSKEEGEYAQVTVYPNPVTDGHLTIAGLQKNAVVTVFNSQGLKVLEQSARGGQSLELNLAVAPGMYILRFNHQAKSFTRKVVVQ